MEKYKEIIDFIRKLYNQPDGFIPLHAPVFNGNEKKYLLDCIDSTFVSSVGKYVDLFEEKIAEYTGAKKAVACVNGTNALYLALKLVGVEANTEVITQPLTFIATANAIAYTGAQPIFLDVDKDTLGLSPQALKNWLKNNVKIETLNSKPITINKLTKKPISACVPMHTFGHPCRIDEILEICTQYNIPVVEDAAESLGSFYKKQHTGTFGEIGILSFNGNKILTTGGGGMLLFKDEELAKKAKHLTTQAKIPHPWEFAHDEIGYNYRMPNINAALGLAQLEQLPAFLKSKRQTAQAYKDFFGCHPDPDSSLKLSGRDVEGSTSTLTFIPEPQNSQSNYWLNCILLQNRTERDAFLKYSNENGIMTRPAWTLMNKMDLFKNCPTDGLENALSLAKRIVNLPSSVKI
ncbi:MAG: aminotransferase DegT [Bacteroidetes bacterium GWF2_33_16]|nr:MAG: aminotransferase DegT [Bacteroidetes bacterium GWE2_32_14]OFY03397.1 MAG: aminotransferase DegT [Bacteroidetes bacterium GWF2_33_16]